MQYNRKPAENNKTLKNNANINISKIRKNKKVKNTTSGKTLMRQKSTPNIHIGKIKKRILNYMLEEEIEDMIPNQSEINKIIIKNKKLDNSLKQIINKIKELKQKEFTEMNNVIEMPKNPEPNEKIEIKDLRKKIKQIEKK